MAGDNLDFLSDISGSRSDGCHLDTIRGRNAFLLVNFVIPVIQNAQHGMFDLIELE